MTAQRRAGGLGVAVWTALLIVYVVWGSTYLAITYTLETIPPFLSAGARFVTAGLIMLGAVAVLRGRIGLRADRRQLLTASVSGILLLAGGNGLVVVGEQRLPSGVAALVVAAVPLWIVVLRTVLGDRPAAVTGLGVLVGFGGVALLFLPGGGTSGELDPAYVALVVLAAFSWSVGSLLVTRKPVPADPLMLTAVEMLAGGVVLFVLGAVAGEPADLDLGGISTASWLALAYLIVFGSLLAFTAYVWLLGRAPVSLVSTYAYVNPAVAVLLGVTIRDEHLTGPAVAGGLLILIAVALVVTAEGRRRRAEAAAAAAAAPEPAVEAA